MLFKNLFELIDEAGLSPEEAAVRLGVSNMTLRRWRKSKSGVEVPAVYRRAFAPAIRDMAAEGLIRPRSLRASGLGEDEADSFQQRLRQLGFPSDIMAAKDSDHSLIDGLAKIGSEPRSKEEVLQKGRQLKRMAAISAEWRDRVEGLLAMVKTNDLVLAEKFVAVGSLVYLLAPLDLIPDAIPVVGLLDDFAVLSIALLFYRKRYPKLFKGKS